LVLLSVAVIAALGFVVLSSGSMCAVLLARDDSVSHPSYNGDVKILSG
jgi:hypothetical protein